MNPAISLSPRPLRRFGCLLFVLLCMLPLTAMAQVPSLSAADRADVQAFTFNEDVFGRLQQVVAQAQALDLKRGQVDMNRVHSLADLAAQMVASDPRTKPLLTKYGFTPRQFLVANLALVTTVLPLQQARTPQQREAVEGKLNPANVRFYEAHKDAMVQMLYAAGR